MVLIKLISILLIVIPVVDVSAPITAQPTSLQLRNDITIDASTIKTLRSLQIIAETKATKFINQAFASSNNISQISLRVLGDRHGLIAPIFTISVSARQWQSSPKIQTWAKYYQMSDVLLGFVSPTPNLPSTPPVVPVTPSSKNPNVQDPPSTPESINLPRTSRPEVQDIPGFRDD